MKQQLNVRVSESTRQKLDALTKRYGTQAEALSVAIDRLFLQEENTMSQKRTYDNLQELTGHEAGAILHSNGEIVITNWAGIPGIPREFATGMIGLGEELSAKRCATPAAVKRAMREHEREQGTDPSRTGFRSWQVGEVVVTINTNWN
jgi:hypothetical protein